MNDDDREGETSKALLIFEVAVDREENIELRCCKLR
jgi:hypothetical protein